MKKLIVLCWIVFFVVTASVWATTVSVVAVKGKVYKKSAANNKWSTCVVGDSLHAKDIIRTSSSAMVKIKQANGTVIVVPENVLIKIDSLCKKNNDPRLLGLMSSIMKSSYSKTYMQSQTTAVAGVRGDEKGEVDVSQLQWMADEETSPAEVYQKAAIDFEQGSFNLAIGKLIGLKKEIDNKTQLYQDCVYLLGNAYFEQAEFDEAKKAYSQAVITGSNKRLADESKYKIALASYNNGDASEVSISLLNDYLKAMPKGSFREEAYTLQYLIYLSNDDAKKAKKVLRNKNTEFPNSDTQ